MKNSINDVSASDVAFALSSASGNASADLTNMIATAEMHLQVLRDQINDGSGLFFNPNRTFKKRQIVVLQKWVMCLQSELDATNKVNSQFPILNNKG